MAGSAPDIASKRSWLITRTWNAKCLLPTQDLDFATILAAMKVEEPGIILILAAVGPCRSLLASNGRIA
jgi:hypothetical protein